MSPMSPLFVLLLLPSLPLVTCDDDPTMQSLMTLVQQQAATIQTLQARMTSMENGAQQSQATDQQQTGQIDDVKGRIDEVKGQIAAINSRLNTQVFFNAHMSGGPVDIGTSNGPIKFDAVASNVGNGYNPQTGVFTAPVTGTYVMYAQMMKESNQGFVTYVIDKSGTVVCRNSVEAANDFDKSSCLANVHLQKGETVIVRRDYGNGQQLHGYWYCAFSGVLVSADAS